MRNIFKQNSFSADRDNFIATIIYWIKIKQAIYVRRYLS